jgi:predicted RNase H-like HicB family nuclease
MDIMTVVFNIAIMKEGDLYVAKCIDNTITSQGKTMDEAIANLKEALELYYEDEPEYAISETSNIFLSTLQISLP